MTNIYIKGEGTKLSTHFHSDEFACPCCGYALVDTQLVHALEYVRLSLGKPVRINSGYRCPKYNKRIKGAKLSRHLTGCAADITWEGAEVDLNDHSSFRSSTALNLFWNHGVFGFGWGGTFMHIDTDTSRKHKTEWRYG